MRVVAACHRYHPVPGGSEKIAQILAEASARAGHHVTVVTQAEPGVPAREELHGVEVIRLPMRVRRGIRFPHRYLQTLRALNPDLLHVHGNRIWCADFYLPVARLFPWAQLGTGHGFYQVRGQPPSVGRLVLRALLPPGPRGAGRLRLRYGARAQPALGVGVSPLQARADPAGRGHDGVPGAFPCSGGGPTLLGVAGAPRGGLCGWILPEQARGPAHRCRRRGRLGLGPGRDRARSPELPLFDGRLRGTGQADGRGAGDPRCGPTARGDRLDPGGGRHRPRERVPKGSGWSSRKRWRPGGRSSRSRPARLARWQRQAEV